MSVPRSYSRLPFRDILVIIVCSAGTILFLALFWLDLNRSLSRQNEAPIGTVTWKYKVAQRRFVDRMLWDRLRRESLVYNRDYIRTAELSEALIGFFGGGEISLNENSLVQIFSAVGGLEVTVNEGEITATAENGMVISSGDRRLVLERGSTANVGAGADGAFNVAITRGNATFRREGRSEQLGSGRVRSFDSTGREQEIRQAVALSPPPNARIFKPQGGEAVPISFSWNKEYYSGQTQLEIAEDRSFTRILFSETSDADRISTSLSGTGTYYWRIYPALSGAGSAPDRPGGRAGENLAEARVFRLTVENIPALVLVSPEEGQLIRYRNNSQIRFQWAFSEDSTRTASLDRQETSARQGGGQATYILELADNPNMVNPALSMQTGVQSLTTALPGPGRWYWRVTPAYPSSLGSSTGGAVVSFFTLEQGGELNAPVLNLPAERAVINTPEKEQSIVFSWRRESEAASYTLQIARDQSLSNPLVLRTVRNNFVSLESGVLTEGGYFWGVFLSDSAGNNSILSSVRSFTIREGEPAPRTVRPPETPPPAAPETPQRPAALREPPVEPPLAEQPVRPPAALHEPPPAEQPVEQRSLVFPGPENRRPLSNTVIGPEELRRSRPIVFEWNPVEGANGYIFTLYRETEDNEKTLILRTGPQAETGYTLADLSVLERGTYIWEAEAVSETGGGIIEKHGITEEYRLTIDLPPLQRNTQGEAGVLYGR